MRKLLFLLMATVLLGVNGMFFWKSRSVKTTSEVCQLTCSIKLPKVNGPFVLPGGLVVTM